MDVKGRWTVTGACGPYNLGGSATVLQTKQHCDIAERSKGGDERCHELVGLFHHDLIIPRVTGVSHPRVESTIWSMRGKGNRSFGHALLRPV